MIRKILKDESGTSFPLALAIVLVCILLSCTVFEYGRLTVLSKGIRNELQRESTKAIQANWVTTYPTIRDGYAGAFKYNSQKDSWDKNIVLRDIKSNLQITLGLVKEGNCYVKYANSKKLYTISNIQVTAINPIFATHSSGNGLTVKISAQLHIPLSFGFERFRGMCTTITVESRFSPKF